MNRELNTLRNLGIGRGAQPLTGAGPKPESKRRPVTDAERFAAMSWQSMANLILNESRDSQDRLKAWELLNANALDIGTYWAGLSHYARSRILGAMALDLSASGFTNQESN